MLDPKPGSLWRVKDPDTIAVSVPTVFIVKRVFNIGETTCSQELPAYYTKLSGPVVVTDLGRFEYYFTRDEMEKYEEIDPDHEDYGLLLLQLT